MSKEIKTFFVCFRTETSFSLIRKRKNAICHLNDFFNFTFENAILKNFCIEKWKMCKSVSVKCSNFYKNDSVSYRILICIVPFVMSFWSVVILQAELDGRSFFFSFYGIIHVFPHVEQNKINLSEQLTVFSWVRVVIVLSFLCCVLYTVVVISIFIIFSLNWVVSLFLTYDFEWPLVSFAALLYIETHIFGEWERIRNEVQSWSGRFLEKTSIKWWFVLILLICD